MRFFEAINQDFVPDKSFHKSPLISAFGKLIRGMNSHEDPFNANAGDYHAFQVMFKLTDEELKALIAAKIFHKTEYGIIVLKSQLLRVYKQTMGINFPTN